MPCVVTDVSQTGARVKVEDGGSLPDDFILRLAGGENPRRVCHLVWRAKSQAGVRFEKEGAKAGPGAAGLKDPTPPATDAAGRNAGIQCRAVGPPAGCGVRASMWPSGCRLPI